MTNVGDEYYAGAKFIMAKAAAGGAVGVTERFAHDRVRAVPHFDELRWFAGGFER